MFGRKRTDDGTVVHRATDLNAVVRYLADRATDRVLIIGPSVDGAFRVATVDQGGVFRTDLISANEPTRLSIAILLAELATIDKVIKIDADEIVFAKAISRRWPGPSATKLVYDLEHA